MKEIVDLFQQAQAAVAAADWEKLFGLLDDSTLQAVGGNSLLWLASQPSTCWGDFPQLAIAELRELGDKIVESARKVQASPQDMQLSLAHRDLVLRHRDALHKETRGQAVSLGRIESLRRSLGQGGSISSSLFLGERLDQVKVEGNQAVARRLHPHGASQLLHFRRRRGGWRIKLI
ncbi:MAG: hypothetical protein U0931_19945 [Vulcanimicrobiota bacterium]